MSSDAAELLSTLRHVYASLADAVEGFNGPALAGKSYCTEWNIADVLSHIGSGAEIFDLLLDAGLGKAEMPGQDRFVAIWDKWNSRDPEEQAVECLAANDLFLQRLEGLTSEELASFHLAAFGMELDAVAFFRMRLSEFAVHTWDIAVVLDHDATIERDAVSFLIDNLSPIVGRSGKPLSTPVTLKVVTTTPHREFALVLNGVGLEPWSGQAAEGEIDIPAEAFIRLVYGRLDDKHTPTLTVKSSTLDLNGLRSVFQGM